MLQHWRIRVSRQLVVCMIIRSCPLLSLVVSPFLLEPVAGSRFVQYWYYLLMMSSHACCWYIIMGTDAAGSPCRRARPRGFTAYLVLLKINDHIVQYCRPERSRLYCSYCTGSYLVPECREKWHMHHFFRCGPILASHVYTCITSACPCINYASVTFS